MHGAWHYLNPERLFIKRGIMNLDQMATHGSHSHQQKLDWPDWIEKSLRPPSGRVAVLYATPYEVIDPPAPNVTTT